MAEHPVFERDMRTAQELFPKLTYGFGKKFLCVNGELDISDKDGNYWGTFQIKILLHYSYPYCVPSLYEVSTIIPRDDDNHIDKKGLCCVDIDHKLLVRSKHSLTIQAFLVEWAYPYFANQLYKLKENKYAGGEYAHRFAGVRQFYYEELKLDETGAINMINVILTKTNDGRNDPCPCGSGTKLKKCHWDAFDFLKSVDKRVLVSDLLRFEKLLL